MLLPNFLVRATSAPMLCALPTTVHTATPHRGASLVRCLLCLVVVCSTRSLAAVLPSGESVVVHTVTECPFGDRWQWVYYRLDAPVTATALIWSIDAVVRSGDGLQVGHWHIEGTPDS